jgi:hypothetical protein
MDRIDAMTAFVATVDKDIAWSAIHPSSDRRAAAPTTFTATREFHPRSPCPFQRIPKG